MFHQSVSHKIIFQNTRFKNEKKVNILSSKCSHNAEFQKITDIYISIARAFSINVENGHALPSH